MAKKSGKAGRKSFSIKLEASSKPTAIDIEKEKLASDEEGVSVSLKYFRKQTECFSEWQPDELKKFSAMLGMVGQLSASKLKAHKPYCEVHKRPPAEDRFTRPDKLSEDLTFFELKVDKSNAARVHGVFVGSVFFLVWLDRLHKVYPE